MIDAIFLDWVIGITNASAIGAWLGDPYESKRIYRTAWIRTRLAVPTTLFSVPFLQSKFSIDINNLKGISKSIQDSFLVLFHASLHNQAHFIFYMLSECWQSSYVTQGYWRNSFWLGPRKTRVFLWYFQARSRGQGQNFLGIHSPSGLHHWFEREFLYLKVTKLGALKKIGKNAGGDEDRRVHPG